MTFSKIKLSLILLVFGVLAFLIYANTFESPFIFDDETQISKNAYIRITQLSLKDIVTAGFKSSKARPVAFISFALNVAAEEIEITASGFGGTEEAAKEQAAQNALLQLVDKTYASTKAFADHRKEVRQFVSDNYADYIGDLENVTVIKKYRRNKITVRIPVSKADLISAIENQFPDLAP